MPDPDSSPTGPRTVVVTGASSGIGAAVVKRLDGAGYRVFAGVRKVSDGEALRQGGSERIVPLLLDVTDAAAIREAARAVREATGTEGLDGLVSNAGIGSSGPLEFVPPEEMRHVLEVNLVGSLAVAQAFLPMLRSKRGGIVFVGSMSGRYGGPMLGAYVASKFGLEGMADVLRREVRRWHVRVCLVEPGPVATRIWEKARADARATRSRLPPEANALYGADLDAIPRRVDREESIAAPVEQVADVVAKALTVPRPKARYPVGKGMKTAALFLRLAPDRFVDWMSRRREGG